MALARTIILFCLLERDLSSAKQRIIILIWEAINTPRRPTLLLHIVSWSCRRPGFLVHDRMEVKLANPNPPPLTLARDREVYSLLLGKGRLLVVVLDQVASVGNVPNFFQRHRKADDGLLCLPRRATPTSIMGSPPVSTTRLDGHQQVRMDGTLLHQPLSVPRPWEAEPRPRPSR